MGGGVQRVRVDEREDADLVSLARGGDLAAYGELVERHRVAACRLAYVIVGDEAEDAAQEAFLKAHRSLGRFRPGAAFRPWLMAIVANEAKNRRRAAGRRAGLALRVSSAAEADGTQSPEEEALALDRREQLAAGLAALGERDRRVIAYRYFAGLSEAEMAEAMRCPPGTVKSRLSRALERLRAALPADMEVSRD